MRFKPVWSDSMGAKSFCCRVETSDLKLLIDPGAAIMQPSFPAPEEKKLRWLEKASAAVSDAAHGADAVVVSHYHFDHFTDFEPGLYEGRTLFLKDPNQYINRSQRKRAEEFIDKLCRRFGGTDLGSVLAEREKRAYADPMESLPSASSRDFGDYAARRKQLLGEGKGRFAGLAGFWNSRQAIPELELGDVKTVHPEGREFVFGDTRLRFTPPMFHGVEYATVGWVCGVTVEDGGKKFLYSSDLCGPVVEDYADWIIEENPNVLVLDGPPTYLLPYMFNMINLRRCLDNLVRIVSEADVGTFIVDHHLLRDKRYEKRLSRVYSAASEKGVDILTFAEYLGEEPVLGAL